MHMFLRMLRRVSDEFILHLIIQPINAKSRNIFKNQYTIQVENKTVETANVNAYREVSGKQRKKAATIGKAGSGNTQTKYSTILKSKKLSPNTTLYIGAASNTKT